MGKPPLTRNRIVAAYVVAVVADILEFPITGAEDLSAGLLAIPAEGADLVLDCAVMGAMTKLLGFHWVFLPSFIIELVPEVDLLPTWVGCVAYVVWQRKKEAAAQAVPSATEINVTPVMGKVPSGLPPPLPSPAELLPGAGDARNPAAERLQKLTALRDQNLISQAEYDTKRQQILSDL